MTEYSIELWRDKYAREQGESIDMTPVFSTTDLDAIKREVESYNIDSTGCAEIIDQEIGEPILHFECGIWTEV